MKRKVAIVTGAAAGIGAACAKRLAEEGIAIGVLDLDDARCAETVNDIVAAGGEAIALAADIRIREHVTKAFAACRETFGGVTIVVNNAGVTDFTPFEQVTEDQWRFVYEVNVLGTFLVIQEALNDMKASGWGRVVNISSSGAQTGAASMATYSSSKGAIITLTRSLAQELGPLGITVNNIAPGSVMGTIMSEANKERWPSSPEKMSKVMPVRRLGVPEDIANACAWLCQDESGYFTGQTVGVNGGRVVS